MLHNPDDDYIIITFHDAIFSLDKKITRLIVIDQKRSFITKTNKKAKCKSHFLDLRFLFALENPIPSDTQDRSRTKIIFRAGQALSAVAK